MRATLDPPPRVQPHAMSEAQDHADVRAVLGGNREAFSGIVRRWQSALLNLAYRFCRDRGRAEDMAQQAFLHAWRRLDTWRGDAPFHIWLLRLAANLYTSELRRRPPPRPGLDRDPAAEDDPVRDDARAARLHRALAALPEPYRETIVLYYFQDRDVAETAALLECPVGTIKARLVRGRALLAEALRPAPETTR